MPTPKNPVGLEAASHLLDRAAHHHHKEFVAALRAEYDDAVLVLLSATTPEEVFAAQGAANTLRRVVERMENAETTLAKHHEKTRSK